MRLGNRTYRPENKTNRVNLVLVNFIWVEVLVRGISPPQGGIPTLNELVIRGILLVCQINVKRVFGTRRLSLWRDVMSFATSSFTQNPR